MDNRVTEVSDEEFEKIRKLMYLRTGVQMGTAKKQLVVSRLGFRLRELGLDSFGEYIALVEEPGGSEAAFFVNALTTNETYFFRHTRQFNFLYEEVLPRIRSECPPLPRHELRVWSAACSTGEEAYSLAIACREFFKNDPSWDFRVFASDVNSRVVAQAEEGRYPAGRLKVTPATLVERYFEADGVSDRGSREPMNRVRGDIRRQVRFSVHNLKEPFPFRRMNIIFLRNVMFYFDRDAKQKVVGLLEDCLVSGGYLFIGLSETLGDIETRLSPVQTGVYRKEAV